METTSHAEYFYPGALVAETETKLLSERSVEAAVQALPEGAYGFRLVDRVTQTATLEDGNTIDHVEWQNKSAMYYPGGLALTTTQIAELPGDHSILLSNMRSNEWPRVVKTRKGWFQPLLAGDSVI